jgi:hypothetical protein
MLGVSAQLEQLLGGVPPPSARKFDGSKAVHLEFGGWGLAILRRVYQVSVIDPDTHKPRSMAQIKRGRGHGSAFVGTLWEPGHAIFKMQPWTP